MDTGPDENFADLPYRASINPEAYERCGQAYFHYFQELDRLGPLEKTDAASVSRKDSGKKVKVGAKPLSGVRGIYYTRGTWRVQYRGADREIVSCVFNYDSKDVLIATFDLAFKLLRRVIYLGRQVKSEDGMIITELTEERLLDLDRRSRQRSTKQDNVGSKELPSVPSKRIIRPRHDRFMGDCDDGDSDPDVYSPVRKKTRPVVDETPYNANMMPHHASMPYMPGTGTTMLSNMGCYPAKLSSFERMFQSYGNFTTHQLISYLIEKNCMRNKERVAPEQHGVCQMGNDVHPTSVDEYGGDIYQPYNPDLSINEHAFNKDVNGMNINSRTCRSEPNDICYMVDPAFSHNIQPDVCNAATGLPCDCDNMTDYDVEQSLHSSKPEDEEVSLGKIEDTFGEGGSNSSGSKMQLVKHNRNEDGSTFCGYRQGYIQM
ncbi:AP2 domain transcription factor AP2X-5, putative [Babesia ovis]|uniref:AP2 domain transcription factor AP2X-5, putative n=1 Tax=Babesia ovis TaxID=5869 RepID=A0A9W5T8D5_BABOV|nr:AP2 domain transcription factor AP2X-5, putative [Babesia ovis]